MAKTKDSDAENALKDCFIITPIGGTGSETFKKTDGLIKSLLSPVLIDFGFRAVPAYEISQSGSITKQVIDHVINDELVIANLTGLNPNVMYELALRHAYKKKIITIAEYGTILPFDISDQRTIFYEDSLHGLTIAAPTLKTYIEDVVKTEVTSNPVVDSLTEAAVIDSFGKETDLTKYMLERFDRLERLLYKTNVSNHSNAQDNNNVTFKMTFKIPKNYSDKMKNGFMNSALKYNYEVISIGIDKEEIELIFRGPYKYKQILENEIKFRADLEYWISDDDRGSKRLNF